MNAMNYDRKTLKERARASMRGIQPRPWKATLVYLLIASLLPMVVSLITQMSGIGDTISRMMDMENALYSTGYMDSEELLHVYLGITQSFVATGIFSFFISILMNLVQVVMGYGYAGYSLKLWRGEQTAVKDVFSGFYLAGRAICTAIMTAVFTFLWTLLVVVLCVCAILIVTVAAAAIDSTALMVIATILIYVAVIAAILVISYRYSLAPYFILTTDMGTMDAIRESKNAMRGNIGRRFVLELSFLGWELLIALIMFLVIYGGIFVSIFFIGVQMAMSGALSEYMDAAATASMMTQMVGGISISVVVAELAALPLSLWLTPYKGASYAGFFLTVTGQDDIPAAPQPAPEYIPPQPSGIWDNVPQPPAFTTPAAPVSEEAEETAVSAQQEEEPSAEQEIEPEEIPAPAEEQPTEPEDTTPPTQEG